MSGVRVIVSYTLCVNGVCLCGFLCNFIVRVCVFVNVCLCAFVGVFVFIFVCICQTYEIIHRYAPKTECGCLRAGKLETVTYVFPPWHRENAASKSTVSLAETRHCRWHL